MCKDGFKHRYGRIGDSRGDGMEGGSTDGIGTVFTVVAQFGGVMLKGRGVGSEEDKAEVSMTAVRAVFCREGVQKCRRGRVLAGTGGAGGGKRRCPLGSDTRRGLLKK
jgi:hypothetical protein